MEKSFKRDIDFFRDISGTNAANRTKALVNIRWFEKNSDGTETDIREVTFQKPIVNILKGAGYTHLYLDFMRDIDVDLRNAWELLAAFYHPANSVSYTPEELEAGVFFNPLAGKEQLVYFPLVQVRISPLGKETEYLISGLNPLGYTLMPPQPGRQFCILDMIFVDEFFVVDSDIERVDMDALKAEAIDAIERGDLDSFMNFYPED